MLSLDMGKAIHVYSTAQHVSPLRTICLPIKHGSIHILQVASVGVKFDALGCEITLVQAHMSHFWLQMTRVRCNTVAYMHTSESKSGD